MTYDKNPFEASDADREAIWDMLVFRDIDAFIAADWNAVSDDFVNEEFFGIDAGRSHNADDWKPLFSSISAYRDEWIKQAKETQSTADQNKIRAALFNLTSLLQIDIEGDFAVAHKKFDGSVWNNDGSQSHLKWQTHYYCKKIEGQWKIRGFTGYMPNPLGAEKPNAAKIVPVSSQHITAGPYSPVLRIAAGSELCVISGQAPISPEGRVVGDTIEEQSQYTLDSCIAQFAAAGYCLDDVFKVNVYLHDIKEWSAFNKIYAEVMPKPFPARTAIQAVLPVEGFKVEIEMWAAKIPTGDSE